MRSRQFIICTCSSAQTVGVVLMSMLTSPRGLLCNISPIILIVYSESLVQLALSNFDNFVLTQW